MPEEMVKYEIAQLTLDQTLTLGNVLHKSGFFRDIKSAAQAQVKVLAGQELGVPPLASMRGVFISPDGGIGLHAALVAALIKRHPRYDYRVQTFSDEEASVEFFENGQSCGIYSLTMKQAKAANMHQQWNKAEAKFKEKHVWKNFPRNMLISRCFTGGGRIYTPDIFIGAIYSPDELEMDGTDDDVITVSAADVTVMEVPQQEPETQTEQKQTPEQDKADLYGHPLKKQGNGDNPEEDQPETDNHFHEPEALRTKLREFAIRYSDQDGDAPTTKHQQQLMAACLDKLCLDTKRRRTFTSDVFGWESAEDMKLCEFHTLNKWMRVPAVGAFEPDADSLDTLKDEANRLVNSVINAEVVGELPGMEDDDG